MSHRQVGHAGLRPAGAAGSRPDKVDRELGMVVVAGHASPARLPLVWLRLVWSSLLHAIGYLLGKAPGRARDEMAALGSFLAHPGRVRAYRRRLRALEVAPGAPEVVKALRPPWWSSLRVAAEAFSGALSDRYRSVAGEVEVASLDELTGDEFASVPEERPRNPWLSPIVVVGVLLVVGSLVAARGLFGLGSLSAPALLPAPESLGAAWAPCLGSDSGCPRPDPAAVARLGRPRVDDAARPAGVAGHPAALRRGAADPAVGLSRRPGRHRRPPGAALGRGELRPAAGLAGRDEPGPALAQRVRDPAADAGAGGPSARPAPPAGARGLARWLGRRCRAWSCWPLSNRRS